MRCVFDKLLRSIKMNSVMVNNHTASCNKFLNKLKLGKDSSPRVVRIYEDKVEVILWQLTKFIQ